MSRPPKGSLGHILLESSDREASLKAFESGKRNAFQSEGFSWQIMLTLANCLYFEHQLQTSIKWSFLWGHFTSSEIKYNLFATNNPNQIINFCS